MKNIFIFINLKVSYCFFVFIIFYFNKYFVHYLMESNQKNEVISILIGQSSIILFEQLYELITIQH
jgi:hypothetical protein